jgi:hypothetical protein
VECENANVDRVAHQQQELAAAAPAEGQHACTARQGDDNIGMQALGALANPQPHQQHEPHRSRLRARDLLRDFARDGHEVYNSPQDNIGAALTALGQLEDTPTIRCLQAHIHFAIAQIEERGLGYSRLVASSCSKSRLEHPRQ